MGEVYVRAERAERAPSLIRRRVAGREGLLGPLVHLTRVGRLGWRRGQLAAQGARLLPSSQQLSQYELENAPVLVVQQLLRCIDPHAGLEGDPGAVLSPGVNRELTPGC